MMGYSKHIHEISRTHVQKWKITNVLNSNLQCGSVACVRGVCVCGCGWCVRARGASGARAAARVSAAA